VEWLGKEEGMETALHKKKSIKDFCGNPVPDSNTTIINVINEPSNTHKKIPRTGNHGRNH
jgi:hypothetical protein